MHDGFFKFQTSKSSIQKKNHEFQGNCSTIFKETTRESPEKIIESVFEAFTTKSAYKITTSIKKTFEQISK